MTKQILTSILLVAITSLLFAQSETINQFDANKKKHGKWIEYLSDKWKIVDDSTKAAYYGYVYYEHGTYLYSKYSDSGINSKLEHADNDKGSTSKLKMLDGEYKWYDSEGRLLSDSYYKNGERLSLKSYTWGLGNKKMMGKQVHQFDDYTKQYKNQPHSYYIEENQSDGKVKRYYMRDGKVGWAAYEE